MSILGDLRIQRLVVGGGNDQPATVEVRLKIATRHQLAAAALHQLTQLGFDLGCNDPQQRTGVGQ
ncbi:hypothetical protein D3C71_1855770 [compost metagenome]